MLAPQISWMRLSLVCAALVAVSGCGNGDNGPEPAAKGSTKLEPGEDLTSYNAARQLTFPVDMFFEYVSNGSYSRIMLTLMNPGPSPASAQIAFKHPETGATVRPTQSVSVPASSRVTILIGKSPIDDARAADLPLDDFSTQHVEDMHYYDIFVDSTQPLIGVVTPGIDWIAAGEETIHDSQTALENSPMFKEIAAELPVSSGALLRVFKLGSGGGTVTSPDLDLDCGDSCTRIGQTGATATLYAVADAGSVFKGWSGGGCSGTGPCSTLLSSEKSVSARFDAAVATPSSFTLTVSNKNPTMGVVAASSGGISCGTACQASYSASASVGLVASAFGGAQFLGWTGACSGTGPCNVMMNQNQTVGASFGMQGAGQCNHDGVCQSGENGQSCGSDCCDVTTSCGVTRAGVSGSAQYCRNITHYDGSVGSMVAEGYEWLTADQTHVWCDEVWEGQTWSPYHTTYTCGGFEGSCRCQTNECTQLDYDAPPP